MHFNTSHVSINPSPGHFGLVSAFYFNTSHVSINREQGTHTLMVTVISIHLMFLLIPDIEVIQVEQAHFNTSHVSINQIYHRQHQACISFQYISCFY